jgi:hypothetical protein
MQETEMATLTAAQLRYREAEYFYSQFIANSGPPCDSYFKMVCYFDAFLFALVSVEEMIDKSDQDRLRAIDVFRFVKALRNTTMHHSVLAAPQPGAKFERPFSRHISESIGGDPEASAMLSIRYDIFRGIFDTIEAERPSEKYTLNAARYYLSKLESQSQPIFLESVLLDALSAVKAFVA